MAIPLPLFAVLACLAGQRLSLELAGVLWVLSYLAYGVFNFQAMRRNQ